MLDAVGQDLDRARDHGEHVVEVMGDAAGQLPDQFHLLRLEQLFFRGAFRGDVPDKGVDDVAVGAAQRRQRHLGEKFASVLVQQRRFVAPADGVARGLAQEAVDPLPVHGALRFRKHQLFHAPADRLGARPSHQRLGVRAPVEDDAGSVGLDEGIERTFDDGLRHSLAVGERLIGARLLRLRAGNPLASYPQAAACAEHCESDGKRDREHRRNRTTGQRRADDRRQHRVRSSSATK